MPSTRPARGLWVGIGCQRGTPRSVIEQAIQAIVRSHGLAESAIVGIATIDTKSSEAGLVEFCRDRSLPLHGFSAARLRSVTVPNPSTGVEATTGTPSVAEAAALLACRTLGERGTEVGELSTAETQTSAGALSRTRRREGAQNRLRLNTRMSPQLCVPKQVFRAEGQPGAVTVAIAEALSRG